MSALERRLAKIETEQKATPLTAEQTKQRTDAFLAKHGMTREQTIAKHGSVGAYCYEVMCAPSIDTKPAANDGLTPQERYMAMLNG